MLKIYPPGIRGRSFYQIRGTLQGKRYDVSTGTTNKAVAEKRKAELEIAILGSRGREDEITFEYAAEQYLRYRENLNDRDYNQVIALIGVLGDKPVQYIVQADLVMAANTLMPDGAAGNKNRWVMRVAAAVMHYAANNNWCAYQRYKLFKEPRPVTRAVSIEVAQLLIANASKPIHKLFLLWLFKHGDRVTDATNVEWGNIDLADGTYRLYIHKTDQWRTAPIDDEVVGLLAELAREAGDAKYVFPWRGRHSVYNWIKRLAKRLKVKFTPHMARHTVGTQLQKSGASQRAIMDRLGHADLKSSMRYQGSDIEVVKAATAKLPKLNLGKE